MEVVPQYSINVSDLDAIAVSIFEACGVAPEPHFRSAPAEFIDALPESLWANSASLDELDIPFLREADGVSLEINGGGSLIIGLERVLEGDVIPDGSVNVLDLIRTANIILNIGPTSTRHELWAADTNFDEEIDLLDLFNMVSIILSNP